MLIYTLFFIGFTIGCSGQSSPDNPTEKLDYSNPRMWYANNQNLTSDVDVFYITPTCVRDWTDSAGVVHHQMDVENMKQRAAIDGSNTLACALFSKSCRFYSPYYRQITMESWMQPQEEIEARYQSAHQDIIAAFTYYMKNLNQGRPFILAGHSQGAKAVLELLKHTVTQQQHQKMVAAYMFGFEIRQADLNNHELLKPAQDSLDCGVVVCYNSVSKPKAILPLFKDNVVAINPINWHTDTKYATAKENLGSVFFKKDGRSDTLFYQVGARIDPSIHTLVIDGLNDDEYYIPSVGKLFPKGNYHVYEINLYFLNLQKNIKQRIEAFKQNKL